jgi:SPP1 gp7 family putative phage head morphogenesis protein
MSLPRVDDFFDEAAETVAFARAYFPFLYAGFQKGADNALAERKRAKGFSEFVRERLRRKSFEHAALAVGATRRQLQKVVAKGLDEGWGVEQLGRNIRKEFGVMSRVRGLRIARTELTDVINDGSNQTLRDEGHRQKEWSTVIDGQQRGSHGTANGQVVGIDDVFRVGGAAARYPGDEHLPPGERINCRCLIVAAGLSDERKRRLGRAFLRTHGALERGFVVHLRRAFRDQRDRALSKFPAP